MANLNLSFALLLCVGTVMVSGHGRLMKPPNRSSIWRLPEFGHLNPDINYDDNALLCGYVHQPDDPGSQCGVCGDPLSSPTPRANEKGGRYDMGLIVATYNAGDVIDIEVDLTTAHLGNMEFRLCHDYTQESQACFNQNVLIIDSGPGAGTTKLPVTNTGWYRTRVRLPPGVRCNRCVIQWNYRGGNQPGNSQETFRGCSDVRIN